MELPKTGRDEEGREIIQVVSTSGDLLWVRYIDSTHFTMAKEIKDLGGPFTVYHIGEMDPRGPQFKIREFLIRKTQEMHGMASYLAPKEPNPPEKPHFSTLSGLFLYSDRYNSPEEAYSVGKLAKNNNSDFDASTDSSYNTDIIFTIQDVLSMTGISSRVRLVKIHEGKCTDMSINHSIKRI